jgi:hypothetical protein
MPLVYRLIFNNTEERRCSLSWGRVRARACAGARSSEQLGYGLHLDPGARMSERGAGVQWQRSERLWLRASAAARWREREVIGSSD